MSDALVELMEPYVCWPPAKDEVDDLEAWLQLGADVWNVTVQATDGPTCERALMQLAADLDVENPIGLVLEIAQRKLARFASDRRRVAAVRVIAKDGRATVQAASVGYLPVSSNK